MQFIKEADVNEICTRLLDASEERITLTPIDAEEILTLISQLISMNVDKRREEVEKSIYECLGENSIIESLGNDVDETFVHYLTTTYAKVYEDVTCEQDYDIVGGAAVLAKDNDTTVPPLTHLPVSKELQVALDNIRSWDYDVFKISQLTKYPLVHTVEASLSEMRLVNDLDLNENKLRKFLMAIEDAYSNNLPYHNHLHAADVTQTALYLCTDGALIDSVSISNLGALAMIIGAAIHDVNHPGVNGKFVISNSQPLAIQYNDLSPLENMHLATAFNLLNNINNNFTERMPRIVYKDLRKMIIDMVLATDNDMHFTLLGKLNEMIGSGELMSPSSPNRPPTFSIAGLANNNGNGSGNNNNNNNNSSGSFALGGPPSTGRRTSRLQSMELITTTTTTTTTATTAASSKYQPSPHTTQKLEASMRRPTMRGSINSGNSSGNNNNNNNNNNSSRGGFSDSPMTSERKQLPSVEINNNNSNNSNNNNVSGGALSPLLLASSPERSPRPRARVGSMAIGEPPQYIPMKQQQLLVLQVALHAADTSGPAKPWLLHDKWTQLVMEEFYKQGDKEREFGVPVTFAYDRYAPVPMPKFQLGFIKAIVQPLYKGLSRISGVNVQPALDCIDNNIKKWEAAAAKESSDSSKK